MCRLKVSVISVTECNHHTVNRVNGVKHTGRKDVSNSKEKKKIEINPSALLLTSYINLEHISLFLYYGFFQL